MNYLLKIPILVVVVFVCVSQNMAQPRVAGNAGPGVVLGDVPAKIDTNARYLIYISGFIVEVGDTRPTSPNFGVYEYDQILETFRRGGFVVISEARKQSPEIEPHAHTVAARIRKLLDAGVPARNITVVGASQGAWIGMLVSTYLKNRGLNFVMIGACGADESFLERVDLHGNVLFIAERTERYPISKCQRFRDDATGVGESKFVETKTGERHGFLYRPIREWVDPTIEWALR